MLGHLDPAALRLPAAPLLAAVRQAASGRGRSLSGLLGDAGYHAYKRIRRAGTASLRQVEDLCDRPGCGRPIRPGERVGLVGEVGACCAACCDLTPAEGRGAA